MECIEPCAHRRRYRSVQRRLCGAASPTVGRRADVDARDAGVDVDIVLGSVKRRFRRWCLGFRAVLGLNGVSDCRRCPRVAIVADLSGYRLDDCCARRSSAALRFPRSSRRTSSAHSTSSSRRSRSRWSWTSVDSGSRSRDRRQGFLNGAGNLRHRRQQVCGRREESRGAVGARIARNRVAAVVGGVDRQFQQRVGDICDAVTEELRGSAWSAAARPSCT